VAAALHDTPQQLEAEPGKASVMKTEDEVSIAELCAPLPIPRSTCLVKACDELSYAKGLCRPHYNKFTKQKKKSLDAWVKARDLRGGHDL
jgi:hypothetical protein